MLKGFIKIRWKQLLRNIIQIGFFRVLFLLMLFLFVGLVLSKQTSKLPNAHYVAGGLVLIIGLIHMIRPDKLFIKSHFVHYQLIYLIEYVIISIPVLTFLFYNERWLDCFFIFVFFYGIINISYGFSQKTLNTKIQEFIPCESIEWKAGIRNSFYLIVPLWIIGLTMSFIIGIVPLVLFVMGIVVLSFYEKGEPSQMVILFEKNPLQFLNQKIRLQFIIFSIISSPLIAGFLLFHPENWYIPVAEYIILSSLHVYFIVTKYAFYEPNKKIPAIQSYGMIGILAILIPIFIPIVWFLSFILYNKSKNNLNFYLNDYN